VSRSILELTSPEVAAAIARRPIAVVPLGSTEQHGPHLPCGSDIIAAELVATDVAGRLDALLVPFGPTGVVLPVDDISNAACEAVAAHIQGTMALPHAYGRLQYGEDLELHFRTMIGTGRNPNVAAAVVIGIEENWTRRIADGIAETGKLVACSRSRATATSRPSAPRRGRRRSLCSGPRSCAASRSSSASSP
jgi:hypothetical protein